VLKALKLGRSKEIKKLSYETTGWFLTRPGVKGIYQQTFMPIEIPSGIGGRLVGGPRFEPLFCIQQSQGIQERLGWSLQGLVACLAVPFKGIKTDMMLYFFKGKLFNSWLLDSYIIQGWFPEEELL